MAAGCCIFHALCPAGAGTGIGERGGGAYLMRAKSYGRCNFPRKDMQGAERELHFGRRGWRGSPRPGAAGEGPPRRTVLPSPRRPEWALLLALLWRCSAGRGAPLQGRQVARRGGRGGPAGPRGRGQAAPGGAIACRKASSHGPTEARVPPPCLGEDPRNSQHIASSYLEPETDMPLLRGGVPTRVRAVAAKPTTSARF